MFVIAKKRLFLIISSILVLASLVSIVAFGLDLSIEFTGGSIIEVEYTDGRPSKETVQMNLNNIGIGSYTLQPVEDDRYALRTKFLEDTDSEPIIEMFQAGGGEIIRESAVGPSVGQELRTKSLTAIVLVVVAIIAFIAFAFRKVSRPVNSWKYGTVAIVALIHDILIPTGVFALLGYLIGYEVDLLFVMGILVILGYSVNDTIVVFDRIRENLLIEHEKLAKGTKDLDGQRFDVVVGQSLDQTFARSLNTSLTTLVVLIALYIFGGESTNHFALMLIVGILAGAYSSIFLASPLLTMIAGQDSRVSRDESMETIKANLSRNERRQSMDDPGLE